MKKKIIATIIATIQISLMMFAMLGGFWIGYLYVWLMLGLPVEPWALPICTVMALATEIAWWWSIRASMKGGE